MLFEVNWAYTLTDTSSVSTQETERSDRKKID